MPERLLHRRRVVARDRRESESVDRRVHEHRRQLQLDEPRVVVVVHVGLRVGAAREDDARDLLVQEELDVVGLRDAARGLDAEHGRVPVLGESAADRLGERGEDRVLQLGHHEAHEPGPFAAELGRPLVAEHVERGEHRVARRGRDAGLAVEHAAHGGLAHPDLARDIRKSPRHDRNGTAGRARTRQPDDGEEPPVKALSGAPRAHDLSMGLDRSNASALERDRPAPARIERCAPRHPRPRHRHRPADGLHEPVAGDAGRRRPGHRRRRDRPPRRRAAARRPHLHHHGDRDARGCAARTRRRLHRRRRDGCHDGDGCRVPRRRARRPRRRPRRRERRPGRTGRRRIARGDGAAARGGRDGARAARGAAGGIRRPPARTARPDEEALRGRPRHPHRHRRVRRHRGPRDERRRGVALRAGARLGGARRRGRHLRVRPDVGPGRRGERPGDLRDHPRAARTARRPREPRGLVPHQPAHGDRRDRRRRARAAARDQRRPDVVDPRRRLRRVDRDLARALRPARERDRTARPHPHRVRRGPLHALARLGIARRPGAPARPARPTSPSRPTGSMRSPCSVRR